MLLPFTGCKLSKNRPFSAANEHLPSLTELMGANITTRHWRRGTKAVSGHQSGSPKPVFLTLDPWAQACRKWGRWVSLAAKKGHHCSAKYLQPLFQQHWLAPPAQNQYLLERNAGWEKPSSDLGRGHSQDMGQHVCQREHTLPAGKCLLTPLLFETSYLPDIWCSQPSRGKGVHCRWIHYPPLGCRLYQFLGLYLKGNPFEEKRNNREM